MNLIQRAIAGIAKRAIKYAGVPLRDPALVEMFGWRETLSGVSVDEYSASNFAAYFRAVNLISSSVAMLGMEIARDTPDGVATYNQHNVTNLLTHCPNPNTIAFCFYEQLQSHALTWGNGYAFIERAGYDAGQGLESNQGPAVALYPLMPNQIRAGWDYEGNKVYHFTKRFEGEENMIFRERDIFYIPGMMYDGLNGTSIARIARESIGLGLATERFGSAFFGNNAVPGGIITHPMDLTDKAKSNIVEEIELKARGPFRARRTVVLDEGMKYTPIGVPPEDSQFLQTRQFQIREMCRWFSIPPHLLYDMESTSFANIEDQGLDFLTYTLQQWITRWTQEADRKLLTKDERQSGAIFSRFRTDKLLAMNKTQLMEYFSKGRNLGLWSVNDIARKLGEKVIKTTAGDQHIAPSTMRTLEQDDPLTPIDINILNSLIATLKELRPTLQDATIIAHMVLPTARDEDVNAIINMLATKGDLTR